MLITVPERRRKHHRVLWGIASIVLISLGVMLFVQTLDAAARAAFIAQYGAIPARVLAEGINWATFQSLVTALFIHADWVHLLGNLAFLWLFGLPCERVMGPLRALGFFLLSGVLANLIVGLQTPQLTTPVIGASGAVSAMVAAYLLLYPGARMGLVVPLGLYVQFIRVPALLVIVSWVGLQIFYTFLSPLFGPVAWWAHLGGFIAGLVLTLPLGVGAGSRRLR